MAVLIGALAALVVSASPAAAERWHYRVALDASLETFTSTLCVEGAAEAFDLAPLSRALRPTLVGARGLGRAQVTAQGGALRVVGAGCVEYRVEPARARDPEVARRVGEDLLFSPDLFLWTAGDVEAPPPRADLTLTVPPGWHVSLPWTGREIPASAFAWRTLAAVTRGAPRAVGPARWVRADAPLDVADEDLARWAGGALGALRTLRGGAPIDSLLLVIEPVGRAPRPVPFAMAVRGGGPTVHALVARDAAPAALVTDWSLTHELSHFALPFVDRADAWLAEGSASYLQNVLRARGGMLSAEAAWAELLAGFERGRAQAAALDLPLAEASARMGELTAFHRVYWSGAALVLMADVELRARGSSFDDALAAARRPMDGRTARPTARALMATMDAAAGAPIWAPLAARWLPARALPDVSATLEALGVRATGGRVTLDPRAPRAAIARQIMSAP